MLTSKTHVLLSTSWGASNSESGDLRSFEQKNDNYDDDQIKRNKRLVVASMIAGTTVVGIFGLMAPFVLGQLRSPLPYMATPARKIQRALKYAVERKRQEDISYLLQQGCTTNNKKQQKELVFIDLGSGDGEAVYQAVRLGYTRAIGIELNFTLYCLAQFRRYCLWSSDQRKRSSFYCQDFFQVSPSLLPQADTVMIFGVQPLMKQISQSVASNCHPGTHVLAYRFPIPLYEDKQYAAQQQEKDSDRITRSESATNDSEKLLRADLMYEEEEMRIYRSRS